jgi:hypothetical protein
VREREWLRLLRAPLDDVWRGLDAVAGDSPRGLVVTGAGYALSWWVYVPLHELLHAWGCIATGGTVTRLEIDAVYGAAMLQRVFPFVAVGSAYAGQLTGFDTHGRDGTFLATDFAPYLLTIGLAVPLLERSLRVRSRPALRAAMFGVALPVALAPFLSLGGDYYEMGSILVTRAVAIAHPGFDVHRWRSDDVAKLVTTLFHSGTGSAVDGLGIALGALLGGALALATYALGSLWAGWLRRRSSRV